jgi:hypothetical protein
MPERVDLFDSTYSHFTEQVLDIIRKNNVSTGCSGSVQRSIS